MQPLPSAESLIRLLGVHGIALPQGPVRVDGYGDSAELSKELLGLIRSGRKRAGTGLLWAYEHDNEPIAAAGDIEIAMVGMKVSFALRKTRAVPPSALRRSGCPKVDAHRVAHHKVKGSHASTRRARVER